MIVCKYWPQKKERHCKRLTVGGGLINYPGKVTTQMLDITTVKLLFNSVMSTKGAKFMCCNIKKIDLETLIERYAYLCIPINLIPEEIIKEYRLQLLEHNRRNYAEIRKDMYGIKKAGKVAK